MSENAKHAKTALLAGHVGSFGAVDFENGGPYVSLANYACDPRGHPVFLFSKLARHTKCLLTDKRASLMITELPDEGDALTGLRATFMGTVEQLSDKAIADTYLAKHPYAAGYIGFGDFSFWRLVPETVHIVGGFGRIETLNASDVF